MKKIFILISVIAIVAISGFLAVKFLPSVMNDLAPLNNVTEESEAVEGDVEQELEREKSKSFILRDVTWTENYEDILLTEEYNVLDNGDNYITLDYIDVLGYQHLPTYLFDDNGTVVAIVYERVLNPEEKEDLARIHQKMASSIHFVYEHLYSEDFKWINSQELNYDTKLWSKAILDGNLVMESIWDGDNEKIMLLSKDTYDFTFMINERNDFDLGGQYFVIINNQYFESNGLDSLK